TTDGRTDTATRARRRGHVTATRAGRAATRAGGRAGGAATRAGGRAGGAATRHRSARSHRVGAAGGEQAAGDEQSDRVAAGSGRDHRGALSDRWRPAAWLGRKYWRSLGSEW